MSETTSPAPQAPGSPPDATVPPPWRDHATGLALFLFIPLVLYLFVGQPEPVGASLVFGVVLMVGHRRLARPYMLAVAPRICLWTHRRLDDRPDVVRLEIVNGPATQPARVLERHALDVARFFTFLRRARPLLVLGIFLPLAVLLTTITWTAVGGAPPFGLSAVTPLFQLSVGVTVNVVAFGYLAVRRVDEPLRVPVPLHNFFLLGVRALLWIFRLVGVLWIVRGAAGLAALG